MTSREADWAALQDPYTDAVSLSAIAERHPEFSAAIATHPQAYPALRDWASSVSSLPSELDVERGRADRPRRWVLPVAAGLAVTAIVVAATIVVPQIIFSAATTADESAAAPDDCDAYLARTPEERAADFADRSIEKWSVDGLTRVPVTSVYDVQCPDHAGDEYPLYDIDTMGDDPRCDVFLGLTLGQQEKWAADLATVEYWGLAESSSSAADLAAGCRDLSLPSQNMVRLSNYLVDLPHRMSWQTRTQLGYSWNAVLGVGEILRGDAVQPLGGQTREDGTTSRLYTPGSACGFDSATDAIIPLSLLLTSTTGDADEIEMSAGWSLRSKNGARPTARAFLEGDFSSGTTCSEQADAFGSARLIVNYDADNEVWTDQTFSVVLKDYYSPRYPDGSSADLTAYELVALPAASRTEDPVAESPSAAIQLDGARP